MGASLNVGAKGESEQARSVMLGGQQGDWARSSRKTWKFTLKLL
jgi:hypothetical protein